MGSSQGRVLAALLGSSSVLGACGHPAEHHEEARASAAPTPLFDLRAPGPQPLAPPPLTRAPVMPTLPSLPSPTRYPKPAPGAEGQDIQGCGRVWTGDAWTPLECIAPPGSAHPAAEVVVPYDAMRAPIETLPRMVDHRVEGTEGPVRKQEGPECTSFAFTSALDHAYARWAGAPGDFSVMQVWGRYHRKQEHAAADANLGDVASNEVDWPYDEAVAHAWRICHGTEKPGDVCGQPVDGAKLEAVDANAVAVITKVEVVPTSELDVLREKLAAGEDAVVTVRMPTFGTAGAPGQRYVVGIPPNNPSRPPHGEHVILLAGYALTPNGNYYLVHNSWGTGWGDHGYAWLHEDFLKAYWTEGLMVIPYVEPLAVLSRRGGHSSAPGAGLGRACDGDLVPDSITGLCAARCPDGSPRHDDVCARPDECLRGQVNLTGACLLAAPTGSGKDPGSGVTWSCGPGGCAYSMPEGALRCDEAPACAVSCPAPDFRLATTPRGFVCVD